MQTQIRIALLGLGRAGSFHQQSLRILSGGRLRQVFDIDRDKARAVAAAFGCSAADSAEEAISDAEVDAVVVATPTQTHYPYVVAALTAGKPVLTEKPLGIDLNEIDHCFALAAEKKLPLFVAFQRRFDPSFGALIRAVDEGAAGRLQFIRSVSRDSPCPSMDYIRISCGIFHDCVVHDFDMVCRVARAAPVEVFAYGSNFIQGIADLSDFDNVAVSLKFPGGLLATVDVNRKSAYGYDQRLEVFGSEGMLRVENRTLTTVVHSGPDDTRHSLGDFSFPTRYRDAYVAEFEAFLDCVRNGRAAPITREEVRLNYLLAEAAERSARQGVPVRLEG